MPLLPALLLLACAGDTAKKAPVQLTIGVAVPLSGPDRAAGEELVRGVRLAAGEAFAVLVDDDTQPGSADSLARIPEVLGAVAHVTGAAADRQAMDWLRVRLPTVLAAPGVFPGMPRVIPPADQLAPCAALLVGEGTFSMRTDGSAEGVQVAKLLSAALPKKMRNEGVVTPGEISTEAAKFKDRREQIVWAGSPETGGNFLRALRTFSQAPFVAISAEEPAFLAAAASAAEGARVTGRTRPPRSTPFVDAYRAKFGVAPSGHAVDGYDAARMLIAAWQSARQVDPNVTRTAITAELRTVVALGSGGPMNFDLDGVLQPISCQRYVVHGGVFVPEASASLGIETPEEEAALPQGAIPAPKPKKRKKLEGEWLGVQAPRGDDPVAHDGPTEKVRTPGR